MVISGLLHPTVLCGDVYCGHSFYSIIRRGTVFQFLFLRMRRCSDRCVKRKNCWQVFISFSSHTHTHTHTHSYCSGPQAWFIPVTSNDKIREPFCDIKKTQGSECCTDHGGVCCSLSLYLPQEDGLVFPWATIINAKRRFAEERNGEGTGLIKGLVCATVWCWRCSASGDFLMKGKQSENMIHYTSDVCRRVRTWDVVRHQ